MNRARNLFINRAISVIPFAGDTFRPTERSESWMPRVGDQHAPASRRRRRRRRAPPSPPFSEPKRDGVLLDRQSERDRWSVSGAETRGIRSSWVHRWRIPIQHPGFLSSKERYRARRHRKFKDSPKPEVISWFVFFS